MFSYNRELFAKIRKTMNLWTIRKKISLKSHISRSAQINKKAVISGQVFISDNVSIGQSKITSENDYSIKIGKDKPSETVY